MKPFALSIGAGIALSLGLVSALSAQGGCTAPTPTEAWVDPYFGNDFTGQTGSPQNPFQTINGALGSVSSPGLVHCLPGVYSNQTNGETFPVWMADGVHVVGYGAKECVIRGDGTDSRPNVGYPLASATPPPNGVITFASREVLVDFSFTMNDTSIEGFTFQGGDAQVYMLNETDSAARISNCVFDLRAGGSQGLYGPSFGILTVSRYHPNHEPNGYFEVRWNIINNTFVQGWRRSDGSPEVALADNVAICNTNDPLDPLVFTDADQNQNLRGVGEPSIQNNLFRQLPAHPRTSMLGVDSLDTTIINGTTTGPTNAFAPSSPANGNATYVSMIVGAVPTPKVAINEGSAVDPGFVGEMIGDTQPGLNNPDVRDWRLLPDSALVDQGSSPNFGPNPCGGRFIAGNDTAYIENPAGIISFDWDCDGYGNPRTVGAETDIGCDETDLLVVAGSYGNDTKGHLTNGWANPALPTGNSVKTYVFPFSGGARLLYTNPATPVGSTAWTVPPGTVMPPVTVNQGLLYLDRNILKAGILTNPVTVMWTNPIDNVMHTFGQSVQTEPTDLDEYYNVQVSYKPTGGARVLTNLAAEIR